MSSSFLCLKHRGLVPLNRAPTLTRDDYKVLGLAAIGLAAGTLVWLLGKAGLITLALAPIALYDPDGLLNPSELERRVLDIQEHADLGYHADAWRLLHKLEDELGHPAEMRIDNGRDQEWILVREYLEDAAGVRLADDHAYRREPGQRSVIIDIH